MPLGVITYFNEEKGYGFITDDEKRSVFVHFSAILGRGYKTLKEGEKVCFHLKQGDRGLEATAVEKV